MLAVGRPREARLHRIGPGPIGSPTSRTCRRGPAFCTSRSCWTCGAARSSAGRCRPACTPTSCSTRINMAATQRQPRDVIHHSRSRLPIHVISLRSPLQRGWHSPVDGHGWRRLRQRDVRELFGTLDASCSTAAASASQAEAPMAVFDDLEGFYNPRRRHSALDYKSPVEYERSYAPRCRVNVWVPTRPPKRGNFKHLWRPTDHRRDR